MLYFIQVLAYQILFVLLYELLFKRDTHYAFHRFYLLGSLFLSFVIPLAVWPKLSEQAFVLQLQLPEIVLGGTEELQQTKAVSFSWLNLVWIAGSVVSGIWFAIRMHSLYKIKANASIEQDSGYSLAKIAKSQDAFSFFNTIYIGDTLGEKESEIIVQHELVHIQQKHSYDLLALELVRIAFWWNPLLWFYQKKIASVHEYIADAEVLKTVTPQSYYQNLLNQTFKTKDFSFVNTFYKSSLLKNRIIMLQKSKSNPKTKWKYALVLPLLVAMLFSSLQINAQEKIKDTKQNKENINVGESSQGILIPLDGSADYILNSKDVVDAQTEIVNITEQETITPFAIVDKAPVYPGCEDAADYKACMTEKLQTLFTENFNTDIYKSDEEENVFMISTFVIDSKGKLGSIDIKAPNKALEEEARRVIHLIPDMTSGEHNGEKVNVHYNLPIRFKLGGKDKE